MSGEQATTHRTQSAPDSRDIATRLSELSKSRAIGSIAEDEFKILWTHAMNPGAIATAPAVDDRKDILVQLEGLSRMRAAGLISGEQFRLLRIRALKTTSLSAPIVAADHDRRHVIDQPAPVILRTVDVLKHVPAAIVLLLLIYLLLEGDALRSMLESGLFQWG
jgi:hypothetical protein